MSILFGRTSHYPYKETGLYVVVMPAPDPGLKS
jgi:hypothetical protein